ncbi:hypothetical protein HPB52_001165 [Rhipicephalus sanguineus]|uniref:CCHC-type domain-containing protein n=1 Tax=Rhipicephalus sanguineus TaxID=34632 RepID=A0A9D4QJD5_RHISA|nr:hypothetical protein HPB52_001165 [Rhipicephalus sanguineus]
MVTVRKSRRLERGRHRVGSPNPMLIIYQSFRPLAPSFAPVAAASVQDPACTDAPVAGPNVDFGFGRGSGRPSPSLGEAASENRTFAGRVHKIARLENCRRESQAQRRGQAKPKPRTSNEPGGTEATADVNSRSNNLGDGATGSDTRPSRAKRINKGKLLKGARMPDLPRGDIKIVLRPRGGLHVSDVTRVELSRAIAAAAQIPANEANEDVVCLNLQQNIVVVSTSKREHADRYAAVGRIDIRGTAHEISTYEAAPHGTVKGVIRGIPLEDTAQEIQDNVVHKHNPTALQANRIGKTRSVVIAFEGHKVPNYVRYGNLLTECTLHRKQIDVCYACGRMGHRMDVCPDPSNELCRGCGISNPTEDHGCIPKCGLCGGNHLTADRACKARFKMPYIVRRRRWERLRAKEDDDAERGNREERGPAGGPRRSSSKQRDRSQTPDRSSNSGGGNGRQSRSRSKPRSGSGKAAATAAGRRRIGPPRSPGPVRDPGPVRSPGTSQPSTEGSPKKSETESLPLTSSQPLKSQANPQRDPSEVTELKRIIERQNAQIKEQNAQIRALMNKIETLVSNGSSANTKPKNNTMAANDAGGLSEVPRRDSPSPRLGCTTGAAEATQRALNNQDAMDAEENRASGEEATTAKTATAATTQIPREGELAAILAAITQINGRLGNMDARLGAVESQLHTLPVKRERLATKVASTSVRNRFASLKKKKERVERITEAIAKRRGRLETSGKDDAETELPGYVTYTDPTENGTAVLVRSNVAATQHVTAQGGCEYTLVEIHAREIGSSGNLFVMSVYCRPSQRQYEFDRIVSQAKGLAGSRPLLILGDFNAPHTTWGYKFQSKRGKALAKAMEDHEMALLNEPDVTTRRGNSTARDTTPDLTWSSGTLNVTWRNEDVDLGSDHSVIGITIRGSRYWAVLGTARITDWDKMRKFTQEQEEASEKESEQAERKQTYTEWARDQKKALQKFTQEIATTSQTPYVDARLTNIVRHNRKLAKRIAVLNKQIAEHAAKLFRENWLKTCDGLQGKLSARKTWCLLRHLIDPLNSKTASNRNLTKVLNMYKGDGRRLLEDLKAKYLNTEKGQYPVPERYEGPDNEELDQPFTMTELAVPCQGIGRREARRDVCLRFCSVMARILSASRLGTTIHW